MPDASECNPEILSHLTPRNLILAYAQGLFPMVEENELSWFSPDPRGLMPLDDRFHVPRRLAQTIRGGRFACTVDRCFDEVMRLCAERIGGDPTWISAEIRIAYGRLHELGLAHSVETWPAGSVGQGSPVGGLYGVAVAGALFAESMFHTATDAGKVALVHLIERLRERGFALCDVQWTSDHLRRFGAFDVSRAEYRSLLARALVLDCRFD